ASVLGEEAVHDEIVGEDPHAALGRLATRRKLFRGGRSRADRREELELDRRPERLRLLVGEERLEDFAGSQRAFGRHAPLLSPGGPRRNPCSALAVSDSMAPLP